jgi:NAD(P)H-dependent flavin oxidoreductase YrpB (nitropropane dioxygenase family)
MDVQKDAIVKAKDEDTRRTYLYTGKTSRATFNKLHNLWEGSGLEPLPFPTQVILASAMVEMFNMAGKKEYIGPFAGQVSGLIQEIKPAAEILQDMVEEAADILTKKLPESVVVK